ncbi:MAG: hypothetical protein J6M90_01880 [Oscillospiraceae bacterium]|jgi:hypothetical protein|nr:hypothetical protein [Oscillospiraceae bacterium]MBQ4256600.1 hypothetical protein [Oscillospiraceae bacterium]MBQ9208336.1 hypothetical protein [Oscillospiraceae bacterium]
MKTDIIKIGGTKDNSEAALVQLQAALSQSEKFAQYNGLKEKDTRRLRLIVEEALGMMKELAQDFTADFWIEGNEETCAVFIDASTDITSEKRSNLLAVSSEKKNILAKGVMGKIRSVFEAALLSYSESYSEMLLNYGVVADPFTMDQYGGFMPYYDNPMWSLRAYTEGIQDGADTDEQKKEAWDELEKSIIANIADDVQIGVMGDRVKMVIYRKNEGK